MTLTVIGWYGTETIGDRAILAGLLHLFSLSDSDDITLNYGSLFPQFTERTLLEDIDFYKDITNNHLKEVKIFYSLSVKELKKNIKNSDLLFIGGGPMMDLPQMYMLKYAFQIARKRGVKTAVLGCGWGPLKDNKYIDIASYLISSADLSILRDIVSVAEYQKYAFSNDNNLPLGLIDPAFFVAQYFRSSQPLEKKDEYISLNLRQAFVVDEGGQGKFTVNDCSYIIQNILDNNPGKIIRFVPMHTFTIGGDDRVILNKMAQLINSDRIVVENVPLSLKETMSIYYNSYYSVGMRYHAILLQMVLNGKNYILDYMPSDKGKTSNMLKQLNLSEVYKDRYVSCENVERIDFLPKIQSVVISDEIINSYKLQYITALRQLLK